MAKQRISLVLLLLLIFLISVPAQFRHTAVELAQPTSEAGAEFGSELAAGDVNGDGFVDIIVGAPYADVGDQRDAGQVFVFFGPAFAAGGVVTLQAPASTQVAQAHFGAVLAVADVNGGGSDILVGAPGATAGGQAAAGLGYVFYGGAMFDTTSDRTLQAPTPQAGARFGVSIAVGDFNGGGPDIVVGANLVDVTFETDMTVAVDAGEAYVFFPPDFAAASAVTLRLTETDGKAQAGARFGTSVAAVNFNNDLNNDTAEFSDVAVGGDRADVSDGTTTQLNAGQVLIFFGAESTAEAPLLDSTADVTLQATTIQASASVGRVMVAGDVNGDSIEDLVVNAPLFDPAASLRDVGEAYVFLGSSSVSSPLTAAAALRGALTNLSYYGTSLALGDVDGDGLSDIIGGAPGIEQTGQAGVGRVLILLSGASLTGVITPTIALQPPVTDNTAPMRDARFGEAVVAADLNGDHLADVIVGTPGAGRVFVFFSNAPIVPFIHSLRGKLEILSTKPETADKSEIFHIFHFPFEICHLSSEKIGVGNDK